MKKYIKGTIVLDIGTNIGFLHKNSVRLVGDNGKVYAFEPGKTNFGYLMQKWGI